MGGTFRRFLDQIPNLTSLLIYFMERSPSCETNRFSVSPPILGILWNSKVHYRFYKFPPPVHIQTQLDPVHVSLSHYLKIHFNIIFPSMPATSKWSLSLSFPHQNHVYAFPFSHTRYMPHQSHSSQFQSPDQYWVRSTDLKLLII